LRSSGWRSGAKTAFIAIRVDRSRPMRLPVWRAIADAIRFHSWALAEELAVCSRQRASEKASSPRRRISSSASASILSIRARRRRNHRRISDPSPLRHYPDIARRMGAIAPEQAWLTGEVMKKRLSKTDDYAEPTFSSRLGAPRADPALRIRVD
jgi:hypothetical protein